MYCTTYSVYVVLRITGSNYGVIPDTTTHSMIPDGVAGWMKLKLHAVATFSNRLIAGNPG